MRDPHRMVFPATPRAAAEYALNYGWETAALRGASPYLCNVNGNINGTPAQVGYPSVYQAFPPTADTLLRWLGAGVYPAGVGVANCLAIYDCLTPSPLTDSLGLGPNLVAAGGPLTGRECVGLGQAGSWTSKVGVELLDNNANRFSDAGGGTFGVPDGEVRSFLAVIRFNPNCSLAGARVIGQEPGAPLWTVALVPPNTLYIYGSAAYVNTSVAATWPEGAWHSVVGVMDSRVPGAHTVALRTDLGDNISAGFAGTMAGAGSIFRIGFGSALNSAGFQLAYLAFFNAEITSAMRANFWRHAQTPVPFLHARLNPLICPIGPSRVACYSGGNVGQAAVGYDASLVSASLGNALGSGYVAEDGLTWLGIGTTAQTAWAGTNATNTATDGPSGMRDSARVSDADVVNAGFVTSGSANLAGATNVAFQFAAWRQAVAAGGTNAVYRAYFTGDGGGPEELTWATDAGTVPVAWGRIAGNCTPVGAAHTAVVVRLYPTDAVAASTGTVDFCVEGGIQNRNFDWLAHRRAAAGATSATTTPSILVVNTANRYYNPLRGRQRIIIGNFQGTSGAVFLGFGLAGTAGSLMLSYNAGQLILRIWDNAAALVAAVNCGAVNTARHVFDVVWDSMVDYFAVLEGGTVLGSFAGPWTPGVAAVTPLGFGCDNSGSNAARCILEAA